MLRAIQDLQIEGEPDILKKVCNAYLENSEPLISTLREAVEMSDTGLLQRSSHSLKSSSANIGAMKLSEISKELEMNCRNNYLENAADLVTAIENEFSEVKEALKREVTST
jgi:HPt (histidine-containing phosphotransfer) domain-containing protein